MKTILAIGTHIVLVPAMFVTTGLAVVWCTVLMSEKTQDDKVQDVLGLIDE